MKDIAVNKRAYHDYFIEDKYEAGMALLGTEIKSVRMGKVSMKEAYISFSNGEAFVKDMHIAQYKEATYNNHDETRDRKLLLHKGDRQTGIQGQTSGLYLYPFADVFQQRQSKTGDRPGKRQDSVRQTRKR